MCVYFIKYNLVFLGLSTNGTFVLALFSYVTINKKQKRLKLLIDNILDKNKYYLSNRIG